MIAHFIPSICTKPPLYFFCYF